MKNDVIKENNAKLRTLLFTDNIVKEYGSEWLLEELILTIPCMELRGYLKDLLDRNEESSYLEALEELGARLCKM